MVSQKNNPNAPVPRNNHGQITNNPAPVKTTGSLPTASIAQYRSGGNNGGSPVPVGTIASKPTFLPGTTVNGLKTGGTFLKADGDWESLGVNGQPSMRLERMTWGGAKTILDRNSKFAQFVETKDLAPLKGVMQDVKKMAERLSSGPYTQKNLNSMGNPYATRIKGLKGMKFKKPSGVANLSIVNVQSGAFLTAWHTSVSKRPGGVELKLYNNEDYAWYLAAGTSKMKAHGPFTAAMVKYIPKINLAWMGIASNAKRAWQQAAINEAAKSSLKAGAK